jgi:eukaryotic-like serine/threonine-protein kinase
MSPHKIIHLKTFPMGKTQDQHAKRLSQLFERVLDLPPSERLQFIEQVCMDESELGAELKALFAAYTSSTANVLRQFSKKGGGPAQANQILTSHSQPEAQDGSEAKLPLEGQQIAHYRLLRELGRGGMGAVFLALDTKLHRRVAIKFVHTNDRQMTERFLDEARTTARCQHENIVVVHEVNEQDGNPYMVLEYLEGESLRQYLDRTAAASSTDSTGAHRSAALPVEEAVAIITSVVRALECAHGRGIIHRDLKPENIFLCRSGHVKVLDFGIAKILPKIALSQQAKEAALLTTLHGPVHALTHENALIGTLPYMAPEQWRGEAIQPCTDMWAVGIILHEMLAGAHPLAPLTYRRLETLGADHK